MQEITTHIKELLFRHDCVILPSFGGFIGNYRPAGIDKTTNKFTPPVKAISFNRNLTHNDGLLIGKVSEARKIGYADSKVLVDEYINTLKSKLEKGERVVIEKIGYFQLNEENSIQFEPDDEANFLLDSYGFSSFTREPVSNYDVVRKATGRDRQPIRTSSSRKMAMRAAIVVPLVAAMIIIPLKTDWLKNSASLNPFTIEQNDIIDSISTLVITEAVTQEVQEDLAAIDSFSDEALESENDSRILSKNNTEVIHYLVAGSFKSSDYAKKLVDQLSEKGFEAEIISSVNGFFRVSLASFPNRQEAIDRRHEILSDYPDCWVLRK